MIGPSSQTLVPRRLTFPLPWPVNAWFDEGPDGLTMVDAGYPWSGPALLKALAGRPLRRLVLTHGHPDHAGAAARVARATGAEVLAHRVEVPFLTGRASLADQPAWWGAALVHRVLRPLEPRPLAEVSPLEEGDRVGRWTVVHTPGHTPGSLSLWDPEERVLLLGDLLVNHLWRPGLGVPWFTLDPRRRRESLRRVADLPARHLLFGHGPPWAGDGPALCRRLAGRSTC